MTITKNASDGTLHITLEPVGGQEEPEEDFRFYPTEGMEEEEEGWERQPDEAETAKRKEDRSEKRYCSHCGEEIDVSFSYCPHCGEKL